MPAPPTATANTRDRLVATTAALFLHQGFTATGVGAITAGSGVPTGSLYHHFPGGKDELAAEALRVAGAGYGLLVGAVIDEAPDLATGIRESFPAAAAMLEASGYADACPIATVALEVASTNEPLRRVTHEVFESWATALSSRLEGAGLAVDRSRELALTYLAALEGGFLLCRAARSPEAMLAVGALVADAVDAALAEVR
ncbi:TetR/AcrR family transcriptional regulator [Aquihabitans sp. G128]|uniref:TetR/AcrR family transcriptional regulator n=1 Tax=Aquihabitans sp. G128 TaxID=2849779 RepID=UPI001C246AF5|nr:TetR/AcrR family transcriptional regulator [Aquihabitans sp. G128]QXC63196.1 TetR/AcrR family transcriptional regulator [Aquihabitans sp. G128]